MPGLRQGDGCGCQGLPVLWGEEQKADLPPLVVLGSAVTYTAYSVGQLMDDLDSNALKAESTYQDQYVELTGRLNVVDSDGDYISIVPQDDQFAILGVQCYLQTEEQRQQVLEMQIDQVITVRGQITSVGEVMGYLLDVDDFGA